MAMTITKQKRGIQSRDTVKKKSGKIRRVHEFYKPFCELGDELMNFTKCFISQTLQSIDFLVKEAKSKDDIEGRQ